MKKIYIITAGDYSAYHICAVTDDPVSAQNLQKRYACYWNDMPDIEEYEITHMETEPDMYWFVSVYTNGQLKCCKYFCVEEEKPSAFDTVRWNNFDKSYDLNIIAPDREHALKIAYDKIAEFKANKELLT